jgi:hypothetical protein
MKSLRGNTKEQWSRFRRNFGRSDREEGSDWRNKWWLLRKRWRFEEDFSFSFPLRFLNPHFVDLLLLLLFGNEFDLWFDFPFDFFITLIKDLVSDLIFDIPLEFFLSKFVYCWDRCLVGGLCSSRGRLNVVGLKKKIAKRGTMLLLGCWWIHVVHI